MDRHLNLIKSEFARQEKRVFPRFPYCFLTFRSDKQDINESKIFEVKDISFTGMQLALKNGEHNYKEKDVLKGNIHWLGMELTIKGVVKWVSSDRIGLAFNREKALISSIRDFLSIKNIVMGIKSIHNSQHDFSIELPSSLKYWLRADGLLEIFIWQHKDGEFSKFQILMLENFVEWEDGIGLKSGRALGRKDIETPLSVDGEFTFEIDHELDISKLNLFSDIISHLEEKHLPRNVIQFLELKLKI
ncbi:MAG: PilZ domain-containing protein [Oligoflexia bacterium]|nr:PilZ domain-containing protein [Oligoflexia bacterium]